ncbi:MAG: PadR family transcriptional regulator [Gemmatimonadales bacterium]
MSKGDFLGELEQVVLLAVAQLGDEGYGVTIQSEIARRSGRRVSLGSVYATLARLETKGLVGSQLGAATATRGGRARRHFRIKPAGLRALEASRRVIERMWEGLDQGAEGHRA